VTTHAFARHPTPYDNPTRGCPRPTTSHHIQTRRHTGSARCARHARAILTNRQPTSPLHWPPDYPSPRVLRPARTTTFPPATRAIRRALPLRNPRHAYPGHLVTPRTTCPPRPSLTTTCLLAARTNRHSAPDHPGSTLPTCRPWPLSLYPTRTTCLGSSLHPTARTRTPLISRQVNPGYAATSQTTALVEAGLPVRHAHPYRAHRLLWTRRPDPSDYPVRLSTLRQCTTPPPSPCHTTCRLGSLPTTCHHDTTQPGRLPLSTPARSARLATTARPTTRRLALQTHRPTPRPLTFPTERLLTAPHVRPLHTTTHLRAVPFPTDRRTSPAPFGSPD
jgi:hypothetical protein